MKGIPVLSTDSETMPRFLRRNRRYREDKFASSSRSSAWEEDVESVESVESVADDPLLEDGESCGIQPSSTDVSVLNMDVRAEAATNAFLPRKLNKPGLSVRPEGK